MKSIGRFKTRKAPAVTNDDLHIDCRTCGEPELGNTVCVRCICESIVRFGEPTRIILRSGPEAEFSRETVDLLRKISDSFCRTSVGRDGRRCAGCVLSRASLEEEKWAELSFENIDEILDTLGKVFIDCPECQTCVSDAESYFAMLRERLTGMSEDAARIAYRIVGA